MTKIPATDRTFHLKSSAHMLQKLRWELGHAYSLVQSQMDMEAAAYFAINAATTAWHLGDWVCVELSENDAWSIAKEKLDAGNEQELTSFLRKDPLLYSCHQIATAFKHRAMLERHRIDGFMTVDSPIEFLVGEEPHSVTTFRVIFPGADIDLMALLHSVERWWQMTLAVLGLLPVEFFEPDQNASDTDAIEIFAG
ncbi:hypothetical protein [Dyella sp. RRB7]|uniref:hypothetical protein n=1 Tax=Dyella sp. RRB7 TaxID=2919502 RepID=UPI001FA9A857|nr:hypothetical protein [Dyella sp. RRB7]